MIFKMVETSKGANVTAASNTILYPVSNVLDSRLSTIYRTDFTTEAEIIFDFGSAGPVSGAVIANHNLTSSVSVLKLQANTINGWGSPAYEVDLTWNKKNINLEFSEQNYRYWRLIITDNTNSDLYLKIGRVWLGESYNTAGIKLNIIHDRKSASKKTTSQSGQTYLDKRYFYSVVSVKFPKITRTQYYELLDLFEIVDIGVPFFVTFDKGGDILETLYVTIDQSGFKLTPLGNRDLYTTGLQLIEEV